MGRNGKSLMGIPWEWELVTKLGMGMGRNENRLHGNGREWECKKPFPGISTWVVSVVTWMWRPWLVVGVLWRAPTASVAN